MVASYFISVFVQNDVRSWMGEVRRTFPRLVKSVFCFEYNLTVELGAIGFKSTEPLLYRSTDEGGGGCSESWWRIFSDGRNVQTCLLNMILDIDKVIHLYEKRGDVVFAYLLFVKF